MINKISSVNSLAYHFQNFDEFEKFDIINV